MNTIKVKDTRMHTAVNYQLYNGGYYQIPVTEAQLVLVECTEEENLKVVNNGERYAMFGFVPSKTQHKYLKPILISLSEKISSNIGKEMGDWSYNTMYKKLFQMNGDITSYNFKVLALPEHFSPKHLSAIVDGEMKDKSSVLVECEQKYGDICLDNGGDVSGGYNPLTPNIKLNSQGHITLHKNEKKMYTREEAIKYAFDFYFDMSIKMKVPFNLISENRDNSEEYFNKNIK